MRGRDLGRFVYWVDQEYPARIDAAPLATADVAALVRAVHVLLGVLATAADALRLAPGAVRQVARGGIPITKPWPDSGHRGPKSGLKVPLASSQYELAKGTFKSPKTNQIHN